ncbi:c-type cytochrome [Mesorhizobium sangaii]|uniref:Mono/diheme cytochrome c family protein n=1 Tax=Mesorhizobium sangaii TaxID=505389 RepID=A0A841P6F1_9HYPH|nr:c-type cytochrome [Mesorhizobium sangaii]MBB6408913.1 mono/diheme cytochrome c family protein [Mesorhizobium sangaii]
MKFLVAAALAGLAFNAAAQELGNGKAEYMNSCAVCHGPEGRGDGPLGDELVKRPADLTRLSRDNGGSFPYWRVFAMIDGRTIVPEHGDRHMPVWGRQFLPGDARKYGPKAGEIVTTERIHELAGYVQTLQQ